VTYSTFQWAGQPQKLPLRLGGSERNEHNAWFLGPTRVSPQNGRADERDQPTPSEALDRISVLYWH